MKKPISLFVLALFATACRSKEAGVPAAAPVVPVAQAPVIAPANVSHGEARVGADTAPAPVSAIAPPRSTQHLQRIRLEISNATVPIGDGVHYAAWTFGGTVRSSWTRSLRIRRRENS